MTTYCTYITIYIGNKFPPFYIGYTKTENIYRGYKGSVCSKEYKDKWKFEIQNNSHLFKTYIISIHSTKEDANKKEIYLQNKLSVLKKPTMYLNRSIGRHCNNLGKNNPMYGKKHKKESIDQQKNKIKENYKNGYINPRKNKKDYDLSLRMKLNNPNKDGHVRKNAIITKETRNKISASNKGKLAHNKIYETFIFKCIECKVEKKLTAKQTNKKRKFCCQRCYQIYKKNLKIK